MRVIGWILLTLTCLGTVYAAPASDSLRIYFHDGQSFLDTRLSHNQQVLDSLRQKMQALTSQYESLVFSVNIRGHASPTGSEETNRRLSHERAEQIVAFLRHYVTLPDSLISVSSNGVDWKNLERLVAADPACPQQARVLEILRRPAHYVPDWLGRIVDERKRLLLYLRQGETYRWLKQRYFQELQNSTIEIHAYRLEKPDAPVMPSLATTALTHWEPTPAPSPWPDVLPLRPQKHVAPKPLHRLALKTNLIYDAILMPSLEVEVRLNKKWSLNLEGDMAWWKNDGQHKYYQLATVSPEGRYWFKTYKPWHGHYVGGFGGFSWYDLENGHKGYKGEAVTVGVSYGYMFPLGRCLSMEAGIGVGYMYTQYEEYLPIDGCYVYQQTEEMSYVGPLKLKLALVWRLWKGANKKGGRL